MYVNMCLKRTILITRVGLWAFKSSTSRKIWTQIQNKHGYAISSGYSCNYTACKLSSFPSSSSHLPSTSSSSIKVYTSIYTFYIHHYKWQKYKVFWLITFVCTIVIYKPLMQYCITQHFYAHLILITFYALLLLKTLIVTISINNFEWNILHVTIKNT